MNKTKGEISCILTVGPETTSLQVESENEPIMLSAEWVKEAEVPDRKQVQDKNVVVLWLADESLQSLPFKVHDYCSTAKA